MVKPNNWPGKINVKKNYAYNYKLFNKCEDTYII